jgi:sugar transferase (PEP-CTERM/EpsH1 system associated)
MTCELLTRIHIVHVIVRLDIGGLENGLVNLINSMPVDRYRHSIICLSGFSDEFRRRIKTSDVEVFSLGKRPGKDLRVYVRMWRLLRKLKPDILHTRNLGTIDMHLPAALAGVEVRIHGEHGWDASDPRGLKKKNIVLRKLFSPLVRRFIPMSRDLADWLQSVVGIKNKKITQIYSGVDTGKFFPISSNEEAFRTEDRALVIGTIGRLDPVKNQVSLLKVLSDLRRSGSFQHRGVSLIIVGDGPSRGCISKAIDELGLGDIVELTGAREDTPDLLRRMDLFVLPSLNEGISNTILEAMATGLPVIAAETGGNPELVVSGKTGTLYQSCGDGLRRAIAGYFGNWDLIRKQGYEGRKRVIEKFSMAAMVASYCQIYEEVICEKGSLHESELKRIS